MKNQIWLPCLLLITACGDKESATDNSSTQSESAAVVTSTPVDVAPVAKVANLPWDIPTMPNVRVIHAASKFSRTTARRGGESTALFVFESSAAELVAYYEQVLPELGFKVTHSRNLDETSSTLTAEHADGRQFQIFANRGGSNAGDGENSATLVATKPKLAE